jgi:succinate-acetate transporter protein
MAKLKPVYLYLIGVFCFILSRMFIGKVEVLNYVFAAIGAILIVLAVRKYIQKRKK